MVMPYGGLNRMKSSPGRTPPFRRAKKETLIQLQCVLIMQANDTIMIGHGWTVNLELPRTHFGPTFVANGAAQAL